MTQFLLLIPLFLKIFEAIPIIDKWVQQLLLAYIKVQREKNNVEFEKACHEAFTGDTDNLATKLGDKFK